MLIQTVALKDVAVFAFHGYYPEEQVLGTKFLVSISVTFQHQGDTENLAHTVNYEVLNNILLKEMANTQQLLETVVKNILDQVLGTYDFLLTATVGIKKMFPPMPGSIHHSFVELNYTKP